MGGQANEYGSALAVAGVVGAGAAAAGGLVLAAHKLDDMAGSDQQRHDAQVAHAMQLDAAIAQQRQAPPSPSLADQVLSRLLGPPPK